MTRTLTIAALFALAACGQKERQQAAKNEREQPAEAFAAEQQQAPELEGSWAVTAIDGKPVSAAMSASFTDGKAIVSAGCVRRAWTYTQKRNVVAFAANPAGSANCEGRGTSAEQETAADALGQASIAIFNKDGSEANLSGTGGNLTLQRR